MNIRRAHLDEATDIANLFLKSFKTALPTVRLAHDDDDIRHWYRTQLIPQGGTWVAEAPDGQLVGFMSLGQGTVEELYLDPSVIGQGLGAKFINIAKQQNPNGLRLFTFQVNARARRFYEHHGFNIVDMNDGSRNEEHEPDILYEWYS